MALCAKTDGGKFAVFSLYCFKETGSTRAPVFANQAKQNVK
jgi:hypothetical protein